MNLDQSGSATIDLNDYVRVAMKDVPKCHGYPHVMRVSSFVQRICRGEQLPSEEKLSAISALTHDLGRIGEADDIGRTAVFTPHQLLSETMSRELLPTHRLVFLLSKKRVETTLTASEVDLVCRAVGQHSQPEPAETLIGRILQDADKLDALGWLGFCRQVEYKTTLSPLQIKHLMIEGEVPVEAREEIKQLISNLSLTAEWFPDMFNTLSGKEIALPLWAETVGYYNRLEALINRSHDWTR